ncbi:hypothetical protein [Nonomuraea sp. JJY05]|uniref:hypothetical protein n=1 Tax=Nonomuraea sp. JJY05 TaxID=3350255 RepID=UPI00373E246E
MSADDDESMAGASRPGAGLLGPMIVPAGGVLVGAINIYLAASLLPTSRRARWPAR